MDASRVIKKIGPLIFLILIYSLVRIPKILSIHEPISDELCLGAFVVELLQGLHLPLPSYVIDPYGGGALLAGAWTAPFFLFFGKTVFALKLAPFFWQILSLIAWYFVFRSHFSSKQIFFILLFLSLPPPHITELSLYNNGYHFEMILWMALTLLIFRRFLEGKFTELNGGFLLGFLGGFSSMLALTNLVTAVVLWIYLALLKETSIRKRIFYGIYSVGFVIGFGPWLLYNWSIHWGGATMVASFFYPKAFPIYLGKNFLKLFLKPAAGLQGLFDFPGFTPGVSRSLSIVMTSLYGLSFLFLLKRQWGFWRKKSAGFNIEVFGLLFQAMLMFLIVAHRLGVDLNYYYLFPLVPFMGMTLVSASWACPRFVRQLLFVFLIASSLIGNYRSTSWPDFGKSLSLKGYSYGILCAALESASGTDPDILNQKLLQLLKGQNLEIKKTCYTNLSSGYFYIEDKKRLEKKRHFINQVEPEFQPILFEKLGGELGLYAHYDPEILQPLLKELAIDKIFYPVVYRGVVDGLNWGKESLSEMVSAALPICDSVSSETKAFCYEGLGTLEDTGHEKTKMEYHPILVQRLQPAMHSFYLMGLGRYFTYSFIYEPEKVKSVIQFLNASERRWFYQGLERGIDLEEDPFIRKEAFRRLTAWRLNG